MSSTRHPAPRGVGVHYEGDLRRSLLDAAAALLAEVGAEHLSLRDLSRRLGVSHAAPAHHFGDREGLLTVLATEGFDLFSAHMEQAQRDGGPTAADGILALGQAYLSFAEEYPGHFDIMFRTALIRADDPAYVEASTRAFAILLRQVAAGQAEGWHSDDDTSRLAVAIWGLTHGLAALGRQGVLEGRIPGSSMQELLVTAHTLLHTHG